MILSNNFKTLTGLSVVDKQILIDTNEVISSLDTLNSTKNAILINLINGFYSKKELFTENKELVLNNHCITALLIRLIESNYFNPRDIISLYSKENFKTFFDNFLNPQTIHYIELSYLIEEEDFSNFIKFSNQLLKIDPFSASRIIINNGLNKLNLTDQDFTEIMNQRIIDLKLTCSLYR